MSSKKRWDAMMVREYESNGETRSQWTKIGAAFENKDGSIGVALDALPMPPAKLILQVPKTEEEWEELRKKREQSRGGGGGSNRNRGGGFAVGSGRRGGQPQRMNQDDFPGFADDDQQEG